MTDGPTTERTASAVWARAAAGYLLVAVLVTWPALLPTKTVLPADVLTIVSPYRELFEDDTPENPLLSDAPFQFFPWMAFLGEELRQGRVPEWNPRILAGVRVTPNGFVTPYYPGFWPLAVLDPLEVYDLFVIAHLAIGGLGLFWLARTFGAAPGPAWAVGLLAFTATPWVRLSVNILHLVGMVGIPWVLAATRRFLERPGRRRAALLALLVGVWWIGGGPQFVYLGTLAVGAYAAVHVVARRHERPALPAMAGFAGSFALGLAIAAPVLLPTAAITGDVLRQREPVESVINTHLPNDHLTRLLLADSQGNAADGEFPEGYVGEWDVDGPFFGVTGLLLLVAGVAAPRWRERRWFLVGGAVALLLAFVAWPNGLLHGFLPGYDRFRTSARWVSVIPVLVAPLAAVGTMALLREDRRTGRTVLWAGGAAVGLAAIWVIGFRDPVFSWADGVAQLLAVALPAAAVATAVMLARRRAALAVALIAASIAGEGLWHGARWLPNVDDSEAYPPVEVARVAEERAGRIMHVGSPLEQYTVFAANVPMVYGLNDLHGVAVLFPRDVDRYLRMIEDYGIYALVNNAAPPVLDPEGAPDPLLDAADVRTLVAPVPVPPPHGSELLDQGPPRVFGRPSPGPALLVPVAEPASEEGMWDAISDPAWDPRSSSAVLGLPEAVEGGEGSVRLLQLTTEAERWEVSAPEGGFLRVSGRYDEGWHAAIDGRETPVHRADGIFRGVVVPPGSHEVSFEYRNPQERTGRPVSVAALLVLVLLVAPWERLRRDRRRAER